MSHKSKQSQRAMHLVGHIARDRLRRRLLTLTIVLGISAAFYAIERSLEHFLWHVGYGGSFGILVAAAITSTGRRVSAFRGAMLAYGWMVVPDLIWLAGKWGRGTPIAHAPWMDVFLLHVSLDQWALATPLVLPVYAAACAMYGLASARAPRSAPGAATKPS